MHVDLDAFFVEVCRRHDPALERVELLIVGGRRNSRGVVQSASYGARAFGVRSGMPIGEAARRCPEATFVKGEFAWYREYETTLDTSRGNAWADWFIGGETNIALNCVDRHVQSERAAELALIAETEDGQVRNYTFAEMAGEVNKVANALKSCGVGKGDTVACYMPMVAEVVFAMLATQKIGAIFIPVFSGYAPPALRERGVDPAADGGAGVVRVSVGPQADVDGDGYPAQLQ